MASSTKEVAVFTNTNLGTHIAMAVSPDISVGDFKRELAKMHFSCFPKIGEIKVYGLMVKQRSNFYHLPDSVPIKYAFRDLKGTWFLHMEARRLVDLERPSLSTFMDAKVIDPNLNGSNFTASLIANAKTVGIISNDKKKMMKSLHGTITPSEELSRAISLCKRKRKKRNNSIGCREDGICKGCPSKNDDSVLSAKGSFEFLVSQNENESAVALNSSSFVEISWEKSSKATSAVGFVRRCLSNLSEVSRLGSPPGDVVDSKTIQNHLLKQKKAKTDDKSSSIQIDATPKFSVRTPVSFPSLNNSSLGSPRNEPLRTDIGKRLIRASKNLSTSAYKKRISILSSKFKNRKLFSPSASSVAKYLVFEISDKDD